VVIDASAFAEATGFAPGFDEDATMESFRSAR
jgi:hypothetical protein